MRTSRERLDMHENRVDRANRKGGRLKTVSPKLNKKTHGHDSVTNTAKEAATPNSLQINVAHATVSRRWYTMSGKGKGSPTGSCW